MNMGITLPLWLVICQWTLLFALGVLTITMYRQIGYLQLLKGRGSEREGLAVGNKAPSFTYVLYNQNVRATFNPQGQWSLLVFADPTCVTCQNTLHAIEKLSPRFVNRLHVLVATTAEPAQIGAIEAFRNASCDVGMVERSVSNKLYHTHVTPFVYVVDQSGTIRAKGVAQEESTLRKLLHQANGSTPNVNVVVS